MWFSLSPYPETLRLKEEAKGNSDARGGDGILPLRSYTVRGGRSPRTLLYVCLLQADSLLLHRKAPDIQEGFMDMSHVIQVYLLRAALHLKERPQGQLVLVGPDVWPPRAHKYRWGWGGTLPG